MGVKAISGGADIPSDGAVITDGQSIPLKKADGTDFIGGATTAAAVVTAGSLSEALLPSNETILKDGQASINVYQYDGNGFFAGTVHVATNEPTIQLANATTRIIVNLGPCQVQNAGATLTVGGTYGVDQGAATPVTLAPAVGIVQDNVALQVPVTGTYTDTITPQVDTNGVITGFTLS